MGWLWSSNKDSTTAESPSQNSTSPDPFKPPPPPPTDTTPPEPTTPPTHNDTDEIQTIISSASAPASQPPPPSPNLTSSPHLITPSTTLPTTLSCRTTFDAAFYCQSLGGQFTNIYRYGSLRNCSSLWGDFWFCVRTNRGFKSPAEKAETIRAWAAAREREKYGGVGRVGVDGEGDGDGEKVSSEDVWEARRWKVKGAFGGDWGER